MHLPSLLLCLYLFYDVTMKQGNRDAIMWLFTIGNTQTPKLTKFRIYNIRKMQKFVNLYVSLLDNPSKMAGEIGIKFETRVDYNLK